MTMDDPSDEQPSDEQRRLLQDVMTLYGEVPTEAIVAKIGTVMDLADDTAIRALMGRMAFNAKCMGQTTDPVDLRSRDAILDVISKLGGFEPASGTFGISL